MYRVIAQYERLRRHYELSEKTYDHVAFLDLSHTLRIWEELKQALSKTDASLTSKALFKSATPNRKILKSFSNLEYIVGFMPDGITTQASQGNLFDWNEKEGDFSIGGSVSRDENLRITMESFYFQFGEVNDNKKSLITNPKIKRLNYIQWLGAEIIKINYRNEEGVLKGISIPRGVFIKRVANILDGSHTSLETGGNFDNKYGPPIKFLMDFKCGGCPIPYYLLLKVAQDIIEFGPKMIRQLAPPHTE